MVMPTLVDSSSSDGRANASVTVLMINRLPAVRNIAYTVH